MKHGMLSLILITTNLRAQQPPIVSFFPFIELTIGISPSSLVVSDFNGDGQPDLAITDETSGTVSILLGVGDGFFLDPVTYAVGIGPRCVAVGDFNRDGDLDLAVA